MDDLAAARRQGFHVKALDDIPELDPASSLAAEAAMELIGGSEPVRYSDVAAWCVASGVGDVSFIARAVRAVEVELRRAKRAHSKHRS